MNKMLSWAAISSAAASWATVAALVGIGVAIPPGAHAAEQKIFALVPKALGVTFYADAEKGCKEEAEKIRRQMSLYRPAAA